MDRELRRTLRVALLVHLLSTGVYAAVAGDRLLRHSADNHYVHLADAILHGQLHIRGEPPNRNDWARFEGRWYVAFPPMPAWLMAPGVAIWGMRFNDRLFTVLCAGLAPAALFLVLARLRSTGRSGRSERDDLVLTALFGFGTVYFFTAVQGSVWFTAHVFAATFTGLYCLAALDGRRPVLAGLALAAAFLCRPPMIGAFPIAVAELLRARAPEATAWRDRLRALARPAVVRGLAAFGLPLCGALALSMVLNQVRFGDPFESGYRYLDIRWRARIETWGLFSVHYLARNLAAALVLLPWLQRAAPFVKVGGHGLAVWFTTPPVAATLWPARRSDLQWPLWLAIGAVALPSLLYQNTGWLQFGYRFSVDFLPFAVLLLAVGGRRMGRGMLVLVALAVAINLFGAITFDRMPAFYDDDLSQRRFFQPD